MFKSFTSMMSSNKEKSEASFSTLPADRSIEKLQDSVFEDNEQMTTATQAQTESVGGHSIPPMSMYAQGDAKQVLGSLNDRLAIYIEKVRELERKNEHLVLKYRELELEKREIESRKTESKTLVNELRKQKEESDELRCRAEASQKKAESEAAELRKQVKRRDQELELVVQDRNQLENRLSLVRNDLNLADSRNSKLEGDMTLMKQDLVTLYHQNEALNAQLEDEIVLRTELQRRIDYELHTYKSLLEEEESRLHIRTPDVSADLVDEKDISTSTRISVTVPKSKSKPKPKQKSAQEFADIKPPEKRRRMGSDK